MKLLSSERTGFDVRVVEHPRRQVRMRLGGLIWAMTCDEALLLANALADALAATGRDQ